MELLLGPEVAELRFRLRFFFQFYFYCGRGVVRRRHRVPEMSVLAWVAQISRCELSWKIAGKPHAKLLFKSGALFSKRALLVR